MFSYQEKFIEMMRHSILHSFYRYGNAKKTYPVLAQAISCVQERLDYYINGRPFKNIAPHNKDYLIDVANFAMLEAMFPHDNHSSFAKPDAISGWQADFSSSFVKMSMESDTSSFVETNERLKSLQSYSDLYIKEGDPINLKSIIYLACEEFHTPSYPDAFHGINIAGDKLSPGLASGISYKELMGSNDGYIHYE